MDVSLKVHVLEGVVLCGRFVWLCVELRITCAVVSCGCGGYVDVVVVGVANCCELHVPLLTGVALAATDA